MAIVQNASTEIDQAAGKVRDLRWFSPRRKRFWVVALVLLYTLLGFFAAPALIRNSVTSLLEEELGRPTTIGEIQLNPYALSLRVQNFELDDTDGVRLAAFDEFLVNFQLASLFKWAWTFSQVELTGAYFHFERFETGETRLDHLLADFASIQPVEPVGKEDTRTSNGVPRLLIRNLDIKNGHIDTLDTLPATPVEMQLSPINISIQELNTIPAHEGQQAVTIHLPNDASLAWSGNLDFVPFESKGELILQGLHVDPVLAYLESMLPLESVSGVISSRLRYHARQDSSGKVKLDVDNMDITLEGLLVSGLTPATRFANIQQVSLRDGKLRYPEQSLYFSQLTVTSPGLEAWMNDDRSISVMDLVPEPDPKDGAAHVDEPTLPWRVGIGEFTIENGSLALTDKSVQPEAIVNLANLQLAMTGINNEDHALIPFNLTAELLEGGNFSVDGQMEILPGFSLTASANTRDIPLSLAQTHARQFAHIAIASGHLHSDLKVELPEGQDIEVSGSFNIPNLEVIDTLAEEKLLAWDNLDVDRFDFTPGEVRFSQLAFTHPFGRIVINEDMSTNLSGLVVSQSEEPSTKDDTASMGFTIGGISIEDGEMDFADFSLPLPFATHIANLGGTISTIATDTAEPANIRLEGQVDEFGLARINGSMNVLDPVRHTDITVEFRNLMMSNLSPYTAAFAGRQIEQGKLDLGLVYAIDQGLLQGENDVVLSDLELGEKVDHPDAQSLPLGLAVSLLKDADGVIRIDLPVEGDVNNPEFKIGGVIWKAFSGLITKIVAAPFKLLGGLIGVESDDFGQFEFLAGRADLTPPELEKIAQLEHALEQRPGLTVEISGVTDRAIDVPALKFIRLRDIATGRLGQAPSEQLDANMMLDEEIRAIAVQLFTERFPTIPPDSLKPAHTAPPTGDPEGKPVFDELAWAVDMWERLLASEVVSDQDLAELATARAEAIKAGFLANGLLEESRFVIAQPRMVESEDGEWVRLELSVASD